jgi:C1A family cysteine protease
MPKGKTRKASYGWVPDKPDQRDFLYSAKRAVPPTLPPSVDLRSKDSPIEDQGHLGSCTANALAGALQFLELKDGLPLVDLSRLFIYYDERILENTVNSDSGAPIRDGIKTLASQGVCPEKMWPYVISKYRLKPSQSCYKNGAQHLITSYYRILTTDEMRTCLADGFPFVFGFSVYASFESAQVAKTGVVPMPQPGEKQMGGHAVMAVGYDDSTSRFLIRNSWGTGWGMNGYFTIPYDYLANRNLSDDFWTIRRGKEM